LPSLTQRLLGAALCARCHRPRPLDCVCASLPVVPLDTMGCVVILQHPHEQRRAFATVPLIQAALANCWVRVTRCERVCRAA
jgi:DTW domain-containing protein YfiP